jgi:hypothetical protein
MNEIRPITKSAVKKALANVSGDLGNQVLYELCSKHPCHKTDQEIIAKTWLIGRSYAAAIERRKNKNAKALSGEEFYEKEVAPPIRRSGIDLSLRSLKTDPSPKNAIRVHHDVMNLFELISNHKNRSLASKYLHFHHPKLFFIFDSRSLSAIRKVTPKVKLQTSDFESGEIDKDYAKFYKRALWLQESLRTTLDRSLSPREIDKVLLYLEDRF